MYVEGKIEKDSYDRLKQKKTKALNDLKIESLDYTSTDIREVKFLDGAINLLSNLKCFWKSASVDLQDKILGSMFPQKLIFDENRVRTHILSELLMDMR